MAEFSGGIRISTTNQWDKYSLVLKCREDSYSVENNTSRIYWWVGIRSNTQYYGFNSVPQQHFKVVVNGTTVHDKGHTLGCGVGQTVGVADGYTTVSHDADGSKTISVSAKYSCSSTLTYAPQDGSCSGNVALTTIPRATSPSIDKPSLDCGSVIKISGTSASSKFSHKVYVTWNGAKTQIGTIASGTTSPSFSYTIPTDWEKNLPNSTSGIATFTLETFSGSTSVGSKSVNATIKVRSGTVPSIGTVSTSDTNSICTGIGQYVQSQSRLKFSIATSGSQGSTITLISTKFEGQTYTGSSFTTGIINSSGTLSYTITVTDSRGRSATKSGSVTVSAYSPPSLTNVSAKRANSSYVVDESSGTYALLHFKVGFTSLSNKNVTSFYIQYRTSGASSWTKINSWDNNYSLEQDYKSGNLFTSATSSYEVAFGVKDKFMSDYSWQIFTVAPTYTLINFGKDGKSLTFFGQDANNANQLTVNGKLQTNDLVITNKICHEHEIADNGNSNAYYKLCRIKIGGYYVNYPIEICYFQRGSKTITKLNILFDSINTTDPNLNKFTYFGHCIGAFIVKASTSTWDVYVKKSEAWDSVGFIYWSCKNTNIALNVVGSSESTVPNGYTKAINYEANTMFPVGAVYLTYNDNNPGNFLGGTWVRFGEGRTLIGQGTGNDGANSRTFNANDTGGEYKHKLSTSELPSHNHSIGAYWSKQEASGYGLATGNVGFYDRVMVSGSGNSGSTGSGNSHNNVQPYITVYFWRRTA